jgi:archaellum component FlaC
MTLSETWFMEGYIDFELQKYRLLAYLQEVKHCFGETKLYPQLSDIVFHYNNLVAFRNNKRFLQEQFPKKLDSINMQRLELVYERMLADNTLMQELEEITGFAINEMKGTISEGAEIYEFVEKQIKIEPVGIVPLYKNEGYIFIHYGSYPDVRIYCYNITLFEHQNARYKGIKMEYIDSRVKNLANTYEQIKIDIIRTIRILPNPAVYKLEFPLTVPFNETLLPVAKRVLVKYMS